MFQTPCARFAALGLLLAGCGNKPSDSLNSEAGVTTSNSTSVASSAAPTATTVVATSGASASASGTVHTVPTGVPNASLSAPLSAPSASESAPHTSATGPALPTQGSHTAGAAGSADPGAAGAGGAAGGSGGVPSAGAGGTGGHPQDAGPTNPGATTLRDKYEGYFNIGAAVDAQSYSTHESILTAHFNSVTSENDMKFESLQPSQGNFTWGAADQMVNWAVSNGMQVRGHALVWHRQTPSWVFAGSNGGSATREELLSRMQAHISAVLDHFRGKVQVWDVVNEAILPDGSFRTGEAAEEIDRSGWYRILGTEYIGAAFRYAREADPEVELFYNDYYNYIPVKWQATRDMLQGLIDEGVPVDGVGLQCHVNIEASSVETHQSYHQTLENMEDAIQAYAALGLKIHITEMDMSVYVGGRTYQPSDYYTVETFTAQMQEQQAQRYREFFELFRKYRDVITSVTFWGVADDNTWLSEFSSGRQDFPLLFDVNHEPKPAFHAVMDF